MHRRLHIHCLGQTDSATLRPDRHQVRRPCHQFASLYYSTSQRFLCHLAGETRQFEIIDTTWACTTHTRWSGQDISAKNHTMSAKNLAEWQVNQLKSNLHMFHWFGGDWDETVRHEKHRQAMRASVFQVRFHLRQEPITRSLHLPYIFESTFARIFLFLEQFSPQASLTTITLFAPTLHEI